MATTDRNVFEKELRIMEIIIVPKTRKGHRPLSKRPRRNFSKRPSAATQEAIEKDHKHDKRNITRKSEVTLKPKTLGINNGNKGIKAMDDTQ